MTKIYTPNFSLYYFGISEMIKQAKPYLDISNKTLRGIIGIRQTRFNPIELKIKYSIVLTEVVERPHIIIEIHQKNHYEKFKHIRNLKIDLDKTPCNFGGCRYWFKCPECNKRIGVLHHSFKTGSWLCMKCGEKQYSTQHLPKLRLFLKEDMYSIVHESILYRHLRKIKRLTWKGRFTKKVRNFIKLCESLNQNPWDYLQFPIIIRDTTF